MDTTSHLSEFEDLFRILDYRFKNCGLLLQAFRHASFVNEQAGVDMDDNERFEFLGDAVLDLAISDILMEKFEKADEGILSKLRAKVVDEAGLCRVAINLNLGRFILLGKGEEQSNGREKPSILANTLEALVGAIYLDAGFNKAKVIVWKLFSPLLNGLDTENIGHDFKSLLQEHTQKKFKMLPKYRLIEEKGPAHDKTFRVELLLRDEVISEAEGKSKKEAEQISARKAFFSLVEKN